MTTKPITGQYECVHQSGVGLDYFTSRIDRLVLQSDGRFTLTVQSRSRLANAAQSLAKGEQMQANAPETRLEGRYDYQDNTLNLYFDNGGYEPGKVSWNGDGVQLGPNFFNKVSDSTLLPPTKRIQKDMDDIAKGLKIASSLGGFAVKAVKTVKDTIQPTQAPPAAQPQPQPARPAPPQPAPAPQPTQAAPQQESRFCDQCGARVTVGKRFCNNCGAQLR